MCTSVIPKITAKNFVIMGDLNNVPGLLGLESPWFVASVELDTANQQIDVRVAHPEGTRFCCCMPVLLLRGI